MPPRIPPRISCRRVHGSAAPVSVFFLRPCLAPSLATPPPPARTYATEVSTSVFRLPEGYVPPTQPPTSRAPDSRKAQLIRTYTSLLRSTPLILFFQHNNLTGTEWAAVRRELRFALDAVSTPEYLGLPPPLADRFASKVQVQIVQTSMFDRALRILEFFDPATVEPVAGVSATGRRIQVRHDHDLSRNAYRAVLDATATPDPHGTRRNLPKPLAPDSLYAQLQPLLVGPMALLTLPGVSPAHVAAALGVLAPSAPAFPAPTRKKRPGYHDPVAQSGLRKLLLVGGRIERSIFDADGVKWVGGIKGGLDGLRAQLLHLLHSAGLGLTTALEGAGKSLWLTMESRRSVMEEQQKGPAGTKEEEGKEEERKKEA